MVAWSVPTHASLGSPCRLVNQRRLIDPRQIEALTNSSHPQHLTNHNPIPLDQQPRCPTQPWLPSSSRGPGFTVPSSLSPTGTPMPLATDSSVSGMLPARATRPIDMRPRLCCFAPPAELCLSPPVPTISSPRRAPRSKPHSAV